jgi:hypothetical protein
MADNGTKTAASRYAQLLTTRDAYTRRAEKQAKVTIPSLFVEQGFTSSTELYTPYQSVGARGVNNMASKLLLALFPPNSPFFKFEIDEQTLKEMTGKEGLKAKMDEALSLYEKKILARMEASPLRTSVFEGLKQAIVAGNVCIYLPNPQDIRVYTLRQYVVKRAPEGMLLEAVIEEEIEDSALPKQAKEALSRGNGDAVSGLPSDAPKDTATGTECRHKVYTYIYWNDTQYQSFQEIAGVRIEGTDGTYKKESLPWLFLRWSKIDGEDYGRAYIEEYYGDLWSLECLMKALNDGAAIMSKVVFFTDPAGTTRAIDVAEAENGAFIEGRSTDITLLQVEKYPDLNFAKGVADDVIQRLSFAFLLNTAIQRNGERVTAEEIRYMARELEDVLGGIYSILSQELQLRLVQIEMAQMAKSNELKPLPKQVKLTIVTGLEALGRGHDLNKLDLFVQGLDQLLGPGTAATYINVSDYLTRRGTAIGIDTKGLVKPEEEIQQERQNAGLAGLAPDAIKAGTQLASKAMESQKPNG